MQIGLYTIVRRAGGINRIVKRLIKSYFNPSLLVARLNGCDKPVERQAKAGALVSQR